MPHTKEKKAFNFSKMKYFSPEYFQPIEGDYMLITEKSDLSVMIQIPSNTTNRHDYLGCIMGYGGTTINLIQKLTSTDIKIEYSSFNQFIKISPKNKFDSIDINIKNLNKASNIIMTIIKAKHIEHNENETYETLKKWQNNERTIMIALNKEVQNLIASKIDISFINKITLKQSITKLLKDKGEVDPEHDSENIPFIEQFTRYIDDKPSLKTLTERYEFSNVYKTYYKDLFEKNFKHNNVIVRGFLNIGDEYISINFRNYSNFFLELYNYYDLSFEVGRITSPSLIRERSDSCIPKFENKSDIEIIDCDKGFEYLRPITPEFIPKNFSKTTSCGKFNFPFTSVERDSVFST